MIEYNIKNPQFFTKTISFISELTDEGFIEFGGKIRISGLDRGMLSMFELYIDKDELDIIKDEERNVAISFDSLSKIMKRLTSADSLKIKFNTKKNRLTVIGKIGKKTKTFGMQEIDLDFKDTTGFIATLMNLKMNVAFAMDVSELSAIVSDIELVSDNINMKALPESILFYSTGYASESVEIEFPTTENFTTDTASYAIYFLKKYVRGFNSMRTIVRYKTDCPLQLFHKLTDKSKFVFFIAPRVDVDD